MFHSVICSPSTFVQSLCEPMLKYCTASMWMPGIVPPSMFQGGNCHCLVTTLGYGEIVTFLTADFFFKNQIGLLLNHQFLTTPRVMPLAAKLNDGFTHRSLTCFCSKTGLNPWEMLLQHLVSVDEECIYIHIHLIHCSLLSHVQQS